MPSYYYEIIDYFESGNIKEARKTQQFSVKVVEILNKHGGGVRAGKAIMEIIGIDCGPCRAPLKKITSTERNKLIEELKLINFF
jgi:N-acetylneuraminate lyase